MPWGGKGKFEVPFGAEILECEADELWPIVCDDFIWDFKPTNDIFPNKFFYLSVSDLVKHFCFHQLGEVVNQYKHIDSLARSDRHFSDYIHPPFHKWPR